MTLPEPPSIVTVYLVDDHDVVRDGLRRLLEDDPGLRVVGEASTVAQAKSDLEDLAPHVVVVDGRLPDGEGVEVCELIRDQLPDTRALMLTSYDDDETLFAAIGAGVSGVLLKQVRGIDFVAAVHSVARGETQLDPSLTSRLLGALARGTGRPAPAAGRPDVGLLTPQERRVLGLITDGLSNREIASELGTSEKTVKNHITKLLGKLGVQRRTQAAVIGARLLNRG